jgi:hypothetical protein
VIVYRRTREQMPAHEEEAADAEGEGVRIKWLRTIKTFEGPETERNGIEPGTETAPVGRTGRDETRICRMTRRSRVRIAPRYSAASLTDAAEAIR